MQLAFERVENTQNIYFGPMAKLTTAGDVFELLQMTKWSTGAKITKLSKDQYLNNETGEIKNFIKSENRSENKRSLKSTFEKIRNLINSNVTSLSRQNCKMVTVTYAENMTDLKRLYRDLEKFRKKAQYEYGKFEYISIIEPQGRGAWHAHEIWIYPKKAPFIANQTMESIWGHGYTKVTKILDVDNLGAYLTAYLGDISLEEYTQSDYVTDGKITVKEVDVKGELKKYVKGGRLSMYPTGTNIIRCSRGVNRPKQEKLFIMSAEKKIGSAKPTFTRAFRISDNKGLDITIKRTYFNSARVD